MDPAFQFFLLIVGVGLFILLVSIAKYFIAKAKSMKDA
jgi:hypothetical protein